MNIVKKAARKRFIRQNVNRIKLQKSEKQIGEMQSRLAKRDSSKEQLFFEEVLAKQPAYQTKTKLQKAVEALLKWQDYRFLPTTL